MSNKISFVFLLTISMSCGIRFSNRQKCFKKTKMILSSVGHQKFTDDYFKLRKQGFFEYYKRPFGLNKIAHYKGTYGLQSDTLFLNFCMDSIPDNLIGLGIICLQKNEIVLINKDTIFNRKFNIKIDKR